MPEIKHIHSLRVQLSFIAPYLYSCCENVISKFNEILSNRLYYHNSINCYSISDLYEIKDKQLHTMLESGVSFGRTHIEECKLCNQKGFICEICKHHKIIYPFDKSTHKCDACGIVVHTNCFNSIKSCKKCQRMKKCQDLPLLDIGE